MEKITQLQFEKSFFNIGAGKDINPLLRFGHMTDTFIYTNLYLSKEEIETWYGEQFFLHYDFKLVEKKVIKSHGNQYFETSLGSHGYVRPVHPFDTEDFLREYKNVFYKSSKEANWLVYYEVIFRPLNKHLKLYIYHGEGLATYLALSKSGQIAPKVLATIQTGFLEFPERHLDTFFAKHAQPLIWIRGFEGDHMIGKNWTKQLDKSGLYKVVGMNFNHYWDVGNYGHARKNIRYCKAFITNQTAEMLNNRSFVHTGLHPKDSLNTQFLGLPDQRSKNSLYVISKRTKHTLLKDAQIWYWEDISPVSDVFFPVTAAVAKEQLSSLSKKLEAKGISLETTIHLTPSCLESEGSIYFQELQSIPNPTVTYAPYPLDFWDLQA
ncbi:hypothetical protein [Mongoliitalea lutea]|uniref:Uncharacterized protein n=1 Tax=Mongoliitalea lutea TaxID=849756 RepID=A0A8J3D3K6_9BACT|nr:hypothetical protein [Mongoliitalea lutea]GHB49218.1 hypothetical protein GCM10008106_32530 [Mongoliitalea lutea]